MNRAPFSRPLSSIEPLEARIAPAAVFIFKDADGNSVKITTSKGTDAQLAEAIGAEIVEPTVNTQLLTIDFTAPELAAIFKGTNLAIVAGESDTDAARTKIGFINAAGLDLGNVSVDGDLSRIVAGDANSKTTGVRSLTLNTFGRFDVVPGDQASEFDSRITGALKTLSVAGDVEGAFLKVLGSDSETPQPTRDVDGRIGSISIGGSLLGTARTNGGAIFATGEIGRVNVAVDVKGFAAVVPPGEGEIVVGQDQNGRIAAGFTMGAVTIGGNLLGGDGRESGQIASGLGMGALKVKNIIGGFGEDSGAVGSGGTLGRIQIEESVIGGAGVRSGSILSSFNMQAVTIGLKVEGGGGENSGFIASAGTMGNVTIGNADVAGSGNLVGGSGLSSGAVGALGNVGAVSILGNLQGGTGPNSGQVVSEATIKSVTVGGNLSGGTSFETGTIGSLKGLGAVLIKGSIIAGSGERSALITTQKASYDEGEEFIAAPIASVTVLGSIDGGEQPEAIGGGDGFLAAIRLVAGDGSAGILASGNLGAVVVKGDVTGGQGNSSGRISSTQNIKSVVIEGNLEGGFGGSSGTVTASGSLGPVLIGGNLEGGAGNFSGVVFSATKMGNVTIGQSLIGGDGFRSGAIETSNESESGADMGAIFIGGNVFGGNSNSGSGSIFSSGKIASVTIGDPKATSDSENESSVGGVFGGDAIGSGSITSWGDLGPVKIKGSLFGGNDNSGRIYSEGRIASLFVGGSIVGGSGDQDSSFEGSGEVGQVYARESIDKVEIVGSLDGSSGDFTAQIRGQALGPVKIGGSIQGDSGEGSGSLIAFSGDIKSVKLGASSGSGSLVAGSNARSGWIAAEGEIGAVEAGSLSGTETARPRISAVEAIGSVTVTFGISHADIFAGYDIDGGPVNGDASIGTVRIVGDAQREIAGNMRATNIVAGVVPGNDGFFGTQDDQPIGGFLEASKAFSRIAKVIIAGDVLQTPVNGSGIPGQFGIVAQHVVSIVVGGQARPLTPGAGNDSLSPPPKLVGTASDTAYGEILTTTVIVDRDI